MSAYIDNKYEILFWHSNFLRMNAPQKSYYHTNIIINTRFFRTHLF